MKAIFPCKGSVILTKHNVDKLYNFYTDNLVNSKMFPVYNNSDYSVQINSFYYLPKNTSIVLNNAHLLTSQALYKALGQDLINATAQNKAQNPQAQKTDFDAPLDDNFIFNHPFFDTLTQVD